MFRLFGFLTLIGLIRSGRHHRRALRRGLLLGAILGFLAQRGKETARAAEHARVAAREAGKTVRNAGKTAGEAAREARKEAFESARKARKEAFEAARKARKETFEAVREARRTAREAMLDARLKMAGLRSEERRQRTEECLRGIQAGIEARKAEHEQRRAERVKEAAAAEPAGAEKEIQKIRDLEENLERDARTAAMMASVPVLEFPEEKEED